MILNLRTLKENLTHNGWAPMKLRKYLIMDLFRLKPLMKGIYLLVEWAQTQVILKTPI